MLDDLSRLAFRLAKLQVKIIANSVQLFPQLKREPPAVVMEKALYLISDMEFPSGNAFLALEILELHAKVLELADRMEKIKNERN